MQGHFKEYVKPAGKKADQGKEVDAEVVVVQANKLVTIVIEAIHGITNNLTIIRNYLRARLTRARFWSQAHPITKVMSILAPKRDWESNLLYKLTFTEKDFNGVDVPHNDAMVLMVNICNYDVKRVLINPGNSLEIMYLNLYNKLHRFIRRKNIRSIDAPIYSFNGESVLPIAIVDVPVRIGEVKISMEFFVMNIDSSYNAILKRHWLGEMKAVVSLFHQKLKFPSPKGTMVVQGKQEDA